MSDIATRVKKIIVDKLGVDEAEVTNEASFTNDLGADSLDTVELIMEFEKEFGVTIPDEDAEKLKTVTLKLTQKAGVDGRLFGSITTFDISSELQKLGFDINKSQVRLTNGLIKMVGDTTVQLVLHTDVVVDLPIAVYGETA